MKRRTVQWRPQEEWTHNRWATQTLNRPHPSALITVHESHGTGPIKPHYLDRENMREQDHWSIRGGGWRDGYHLLSADWSSWGGWHFWRSSEAWRWHRFVTRQLLCVHLTSVLAQISAHWPFSKWTSTLTGPDALFLISTRRLLIVDWDEVPFSMVPCEKLCRWKWCSNSMNCVSGGETWLRCRDKRTPVRDDYPDWQTLAFHAHYLNSLFLTATC